MKKYKNLFQGDIKNINMIKSYLKISDFGISIKGKQIFTLIGAQHTLTK